MPRISDYLETARHQNFIGRRDALEVFTSAIEAAELPFFALYVYGPGGLGKSCLLQEYQRRCQTMGVAAIYVDGRDIEPTPEQFQRTLVRAAGATGDRSLIELLTERAQHGRQVILIDTYESLLPLDDWLRDVLLPDMPEAVLWCIAGRAEPTPGWRLDPGWQALLRTIPLRNLTPDESREFLQRRYLPTEQIPAIIEFTHGHPLALSLVADVFDQRPDYRFHADNASLIIELLVAQLLEEAPGGEHRAALEVCSLLRGVTEGALAEILETPNANALFLWLRGLSFMDSGPRGLFLHDLARDVLHADLRWRNPDWYAELHRRARAYYTARFATAQGREQQRTLFDLIYLHRENPMVRPFLEWQTVASMLPDRLRDGDPEQMVALVERHEGPQSARIAAHWFARQPHNVLLFRDLQGQIIGFATFVELSEVDDGDLSADPGIRCAFDFLMRHAPLRAEEKATHFRFWMSTDSYQSVSPLQSLIFTNMVRHYLTKPGLAYTLLPCADPEFWAAAFAYADLSRLPEADYEIDGRHYGVYGHDWRVTTPLDWLALLGERELGVSPDALATTPAIRTLVLSEEEFVQAVRDALQNLNRPEVLVNNPLLRSRLVKDHIEDDADEAQRIAELQRQIVAAVSRLDTTPRQRKLHRAVYHTYVQPVGTQEKAAELLGLPFSTYRRHLRNGISAVADMLWKEELGSDGLGTNTI